MSEGAGLPELLIYGRKKQVIPGALLLFFGIIVLSLGITFGIMAVIGEDVGEMARDVFQAKSLIYLFIGLAIMSVPTLLIYSVLAIGERRFLGVYNKMPETARRRFREEWLKKRHPGELPVYEDLEEGYILFYDRSFFNMPQIAAWKDIVWGYIGHHDVGITDMEKGIIMPNIRFYSLCFHTKDGRRHRIYVHISQQETIEWFISRCPRAILGYGREQKRQAEEIFRAEAERTAFLTGEEKDSYLLRKKRMRLAAAGGSLFAVLILAAGIRAYQYMKTDAYLYLKNMWKADGYFEEGEWSRAYKYYYAARGYAEDEKEAFKGMLLSILGMAKNDGYLDSIIRDYETLFSRQDLFTGERDISDWYFDCTEYYLAYDDPMGAVDLLERGIETFSLEETVVEEKSGAEDKKVWSVFGGYGKGSLSEEREQEIREQIINRMAEKREEILGRCQIAGITEYHSGKRSRFVQYEDGAETLAVSYFTGYSMWFYKTYDENGNLILVETYKKKDGGEEKTREEYYEYDDRGNLIHNETYDLQWNLKVYDMVNRYDGDGNLIYHCEMYEGDIFLERECMILSDTRRIEREYNVDSIEGYQADKPEEECWSYTEEKRDSKGNLIEWASYTGTSSVEEIQSGEAKALTRYTYTYDGGGNNTGKYCVRGEEDGLTPVFERIYDNRGNMIQEIDYPGIEDGGMPYVETTLREYNESNLLVKEKRTLGGENGIWMDVTELYAYDEAGNLIRTDYLDQNGERYLSVVREYDILGNLIREYKTDGEKETLADGEAPDREWKYRYHYH